MSEESDRILVHDMSAYKPDTEENYKRQEGLAKKILDEKEVCQTCGGDPERHDLACDGLMESSYSELALKNKDLKVALILALNALGDTENTSARLAAVLQGNKALNK